MNHNGVPRTTADMKNIIGRVRVEAEKVTISVPFYTWLKLLCAIKRQTS